MKPEQGNDEKRIRLLLVGALPFAKQETSILYLANLAGGKN